MKRTIFTILTIMIILVFTGCDPILEALYPDEKIGDGPNNTINVLVELNQNIIDQTAYQDAPRVNVLLQQSLDGGTTWDDFDQGEVWDIWGEWEIRSVPFSYLPPGKYRAVIYFDENWDWYVDAGEDRTIADDWDGGIVDFVEDDPADYKELRGKLNAGDSDAL